MNSDDTLEKLLEILTEIRNLKRSEKLRNTLKIVLVGFFLENKHNEIQTLILKANKIIDNIIENRFVEINKNSLYEKSDLFQELDKIKEILTSFSKVFETSAYNSNLNRINLLHRKLAEQSRKLVQFKIDRITNQMEQIFDSGSYLTTPRKNETLSSIETFENELKQVHNYPFIDVDYILNVKKRIEDVKRKILNYNSNFVNQRKRDYDYLWSNGKFTLDDEQQTAIITDDKHNLVIAAAGSGKTEVLITRIEYIVKRKPDSSPQKRILAIAFQTKAREEIEKRLSERFGLNDINVSTFHKLGKNILEESRSKYRHTDVINDNKKHRIIGEIFDTRVEKEPEFYKLFLNYIKTLNDKDSKPQETEDSLEYIKGQAYVCIDGTKVNSRDEKEIMDFFLTHKLNNEEIKVEYEKDIEDFRPDFYLPKFDIYLEHWGLDKNGEVPNWFSQSTDEYKQSMAMKKRWFVSHNKVLIETYSHEYNRENPDQFIELLKKRITDSLQRKYRKNFEFILKSYEEIVELAWDSYRTPVEELVSFITTAKTYGLTPEKIRKRLKENGWTRKQIAFGKMVLPIFEEYEEFLQTKDKIDFEDMINLAIAELEKIPLLRSDFYDHILIDEYQDISAQRYKLIKTLMDRNPNCKLFCVGDDWQSIMSFSGSNVNFFANFSNYFEDPAITIISTNYRSQSIIVNAGANLIKNNTSCQIQKPARAKNDSSKPIQLYCSTYEKNRKCSYQDQIAEDCVNRVLDYLKNGYTPNDIIILSRCLKTRTRHGYKYLPVVKLIKDLAEENDLDVTHESWQRTKSIRLLTAHGSKGLEAKVVFLLDVIDDTFGFPCKIEDSNIIELARINYPPQDNLEEERRLFYVAMTRAIEDLNIYSWQPSMSQFIEEIKEYTKTTALPKN